MEASSSDVSSASTKETKTIIDNNGDLFSVFDDASCGEPFCAHRIRLDFTPNEEIDNEYVQKKCCAFWNFIKGLPEIQNLMVKPKKNLDFESAKLSLEASTSRSRATETESTEFIKERTALSMLEFVEEKGLIDRTFEAKIHESHCTMGSREYKESAETKRKPQAVPCHPCGVLCTCCAKTDPLKTLVHTMQDWDAGHPKSFEEPIHPPSLQPGILQRTASESSRRSD